MGKGVIWGIFLVLLLSMVYAVPEIFREDGNVGMKIIVPDQPKIIKQTGFEKNFYYDFSQVDATHWDVTVCHKNYAKNKNHKLKDNSDLGNYPVEVQDKNTKIKKADKPKLKLKNNQCQTFTTEILPNDLLKLGEDSTEIIISDDNVTIVITPETSECVEKSCSSEIIFINDGTTPIIFNSDDLYVSIENSIFHQLLYWNGTHLTDNPDVLTLNPNDRFEFFLNSEQQDYGFWKYNVTFNYSGTEHTIDPYYNATNSTPPRAEFNTADNQIILPNAVFNISGDALDYFNLTDVTYEVTKPDLTKTNFSLPIQAGFDTKRDNPLWTGLDNFATYFGDFNTVYVQLGRFLILTNLSNNFSFNRMAWEINAMIGNPDQESFMMNIILCETNVSALTTSSDRASDCTSPIIIVDTINISEQIGDTQFGTYALMKMNNRLNLTVNVSHIIAFEYSSGFVSDGANDFWSVRGDAFVGVNNYGRVLNQNSTFFTSFIPSVKLFDDYNQTYTDTSAEGNYSVKMYATDFHGNINDSETITFRVCEHNWTAQFTTCLLNDSQIKTYIDSANCPIGNPVPVDNNTVIACNYCSEDIELVQSNCYHENATDFQNNSYIDNNYFSCCAISGQPSDCSILTSPYNETIFQICNITLENDFILELDIDLQFGFGFGGLSSDKVTGKIWINDTNTTYYCLSYVKTTDGNLLQTNPHYTERVGGGLLQFIPKEVESREFFVTQNGLASIYFTDDNIIKDQRNYIWGVECSGNNQLLKSEILASAGYEAVDEPITRWVWAKDNVFGIVVFMFILIILLIGGYFIYRVGLK